jgi:hypothetical protein
MGKLDVQPVQAPELKRARYQHGSLDGVDADIVGYAREVAHGALLDLFDVRPSGVWASGTWGRRIFGLRACASHDRKH